jgi:prolyl oligopeptidase
LDKIPYRAAIKARLEALNNYEKLGSPFKRGEYIYFYKNDGLQNHYVIYRKKGEQGEVEVFLDPNTFSADGTTRLGGVSFSKDGSRVAYQLSVGGQDWTDAVIIDAVTKQPLRRYHPRYKIQWYFVARQRWLLFQHLRKTKGQSAFG